MTMENNTSSGAWGTTVLLILFVGLKLADYIDWPWVWVLAPLWIPVGLVLILLLIKLIIRLYLDR